MIPQFKDRMEKTLTSLRQELGKLRSGRASLGMLDDVRVDAYGQLMTLTHVATLNIPEPRMITIQPWDASLIPEIEKAILKAQLGLTPANDGKLIRLTIPALTEERRKEMVKMVKRHGEEAKVAIRNTRREANEAVKNAEGDGFSEDDVKRTQTDVQKLTDDFVKKIDETVAHKEKELMTV